MRHTQLTTLAVAVAALLLSSCGDGKPKVNTYAMGDKVRVGRLTYTVFETQWLAKLGVGPTPRIPEHRFLLIRASIASGASADVVSPNVSLEDNKGNTYSELSNGEGVPQWIGYLRHLRPAESAQGNLLFDVPPGRYAMRVLDENSDEAALIEIPLSFNAETPDIPAVPQK